MSPLQKNWLLYVVGMLLLASIAFGNLLTHNFWDGADDLSILKDIRVVATDLTFILSPERGHDARPPFDLVFLMGYLTWGENPVAFHCFHILLHVGASLLITCTLYKEKIPLSLCFLTGAFFLVNVAHFRAVHWITSINYVLALILILLVYLSHLKSSQSNPTGWKVLSCVFLFLAVWTHPAAVFIAPFCTYRLWQSSRSFANAIKSSALLLITGPIFVLTAHLISVHGQSDAAFSSFSASRILTNFFWYLSDLIVSAHWVFRATTDNTASGWELALGVIFFGVLVLFYKGKKAGLSACAIWVMLSILPFINNPPERLSVGPSRHLYFASVGSSFLFAYACTHLVNWLRSHMSTPLCKATYCGLVGLILLSSIWHLKKAEALSIYYTAVSTKSLSLFERAEKEAPNLVPTKIYDYLMQMGLARGKTYDNRIDLALQKNPNDPLLNMLWGVTLNRSENIKTQEKGDNYLQKAISLSDQAPEMYYNIAVALQNAAVLYNQANDLERAASLYEKALNYYPNHRLALYSLAEIYRTENKMQKAINLLQNLTEIDPSHTDAHKQLAKLLFLEGRRDQALPYFIRAVQLAPQDHILAFNLGQTLLSLNRFRDAIPVFQRAIQLAPQDDRPYLSLAHTYQAINDISSAIATYQNLLLRFPNHPQAQQALQGLQTIQPQ